ncbi:MAG: SafA/ExsA family spore coat assembly protein, partial [Oscillospiraceae bacterium]|nr:SafA/ExsA family spore coat assembly protein [Oscillospiraceae bacterium]
MKHIKKAVALLLLLSAIASPSPALAASGAHTVSAGDSMWKIAVRYQIGLAELIQANPQIKDPAKITVGQKVNIPNI